MIIDVHSHVYARPLLGRPGRPDQTFLSVEQQLARMEEKGVDMAVVLPLNSAEAPAERQSPGEVLSICKQHPDRLIPFLDLDPRRPDWRDTEHFVWALELYKDAGFRGIGEVTARIPFDDPKMMAFLGACEKVGFSVTFHTSPPEVVTYGIIDELGMPRFERVLRAFPQLRFFGHSASFWSEISGDLTAAAKEGYPKGPIAPGGALVRLMREFPNLNGDISAGSGFNAITRDPAFSHEFMDEFQDRLMLGLDLTSMDVQFEHIDWLGEQRDEGHISSEILEKILWKNANRLIGLGLE